jgi:hypothetical protein
LSINGERAEKFKAAGTHDFSDFEILLKGEGTTTRDQPEHFLVAFIFFNDLYTTPE